jgi:hypothetical protein
MKVSINSIDASSEKPLGYTPMPSFLVHFQGTAFSGVARLVPASGLPTNCVGAEFDTEIAQESISDFQVVESTDPTVSYLGQPGVFKVLGRVVGVSPVTEPQGGFIVTVVVNDAFFMLTHADLDFKRPEVGAMVEFTTRELALWDEVI